MSKNGEIKNFSKDKGFEIIPRSLLQHESLSLQAIGLLCNLQSYPEDWKLYKTELYTRYKKNKRTSVSNAWNELVEEGYIIELRRRNGKKYDYIYYFNLTPFTKEEAAQIIEQEQAEILGCRFSTPQEKARQDNDFWDVDFEQSNLSSPKPAANRIHIQENTHENNREEEEIYITRTREENIIFQFLNDFLQEKGLDQKTIDKTIHELVKRNVHTFSIQDVEKQYAHIMDKQSKGKRIYDFATYFVNGLVDLTEQATASRLYENEKMREYEIAMQRRQEMTDGFPFYNWLEERTDDAQTAFLWLKRVKLP